MGMWKWVPDKKAKHNHEAGSSSAFGRMTPYEKGFFYGFFAGVVFIPALVLTGGILFCIGKFIVAKVRAFCNPPQGGAGGGGQAEGGGGAAV
ncbi:hypothetical protein TRIUR3_25615 [Triticum urartu]|uniref:Uncharacterized protein n=1 Tax=Triticum urartu TaxID=4572 RepID=M7ZCM3_TRIUA|nr:hypothetical protein TRIUR3_25615 [Triticum urartu]